jgi:hypothetical protein
MDYSELKKQYRDKPINAIYNDYKAGIIDKELAYTWYNRNVKFIGAMLSNYPSLEGKKNLTTCEKCLAEIETDSGLNSPRQTIDIQGAVNRLISSHLAKQTSQPQSLPVAPRQDIQESKIPNQTEEQPATKADIEKLESILKQKRNRESKITGKLAALETLPDEINMKLREAGLIEYDGQTIKPMKLPSLVRVLEKFAEFRNLRKVEKVNYIVRHFQKEDKNGNTSRYEKKNSSTIYSALASKSNL